jgi:hypothetical protein
MKRTRLLGLALTAAFAVTAFSAAAAPAVEGPFYKVNGKALAAGETRLLLVTAKEKFILESKNVAISISCTTLNLPEAGQMQIQGVAAGNSGIGKEVIEYAGCTVEGNGEGCEVEGEKIKTNPVLSLLGYGSAARTGQVLVLFEPERGTSIGTLKFTGVKCKFKTFAMEGTWVGAARVAGQPVLTGGGTETLHGEVAFPHVQLIFIEQGKALKHVKASMKWSGVAATQSGVALLLVDEAGTPVKWGVFS